MHLARNGELMSEARLGLLRQRSQIQFCIDAFVDETKYVPLSACALRSPSALTLSLELLVNHMPATIGWRAWAEGARVWFVEGTLLEVTERSLDKPTMFLTFRDEDACAVASGAWCRIGPAKWELLEFSGHSFESVVNW